MDQLFDQCTVRRRTSRWPLALFYNIMDVACLVAYIIYYENYKIVIKKSYPRKSFVTQLGQKLAKPVVEDRSKSSRILKNYRTKLAIVAIECMIGRLVPIINCSTGPPPNLDHTGRKVLVKGCCHLCNTDSTKRRRKTNRKTCYNCKISMCNQYPVTFPVCKECEMKE